MKVTFYSNFMNHHQLPFCLEMVKILGEGFKFIATQPIDRERTSMGYRGMNHNRMRGWSGIVDKPGSHHDADVSYQRICDSCKLFDNEPMNEAKGSSFCDHMGCAKKSEKTFFGVFIIWRSCGQIV